MTLVEEAAGNGCRRAAAYAELDISLRTYQRWTREGAEGMKDGRKGAQRAAPANKLSDEERARILALVNSPEFASQPPSQIVPTLVDRGQYLASESTIYRVMKAAAQQHHPGPGQEARYPRGDEPLRHRTESPVVVGHYLAADRGEGHVFLLVHGARRVQPEDCGPRGARGRVRGTGSAAHAQGKPG